MPVRRSVVIDLIGDLDALLGEIFAETLGRISASGDAVVVDFKHVSLMHADGLARVSNAIAESRLGGSSIDVVARNRRLRSLLRDARIVSDETPLPPARARHVMIARHARA